MSAQSYEQAAANALAVLEHDVDTKAAREQEYRRDVDEAAAALAGEELTDQPALANALRILEKRHDAARRSLALAREARDRARTKHQGAQAAAHPKDNVAQEQPTMLETAPTASAANGMHMLVVKKRFRFNYPSGIQRSFVEGTHWLDPNNPHDAEFLNHPWVAQGFADDNIERPEHRQKREAEQKAVVDAAIERANAMRAEHSFRPVATMHHADPNSTQAAYDEMHTPLDRRVGPNAQALQAELNTPLNQLRKIG